MIRLTVQLGGVDIEAMSKKKMKVVRDAHASRTAAEDECLER